MPELSGRRRFAHLLRRAGFGPAESEIDAAMALDPDENVAFTRAVDALLEYEQVAEVTDRFQPTADDNNLLIKWWLERMVRTKRPLLEKMVFFWHDHFATASDKDGIDVTKMKLQNEFFRANALGNFQQILNGISRDPAMILWLDLNSNRKNRPNENYARELMELFALGIGEPSNPNYDEDDIREATRAFTGYTVGGTPEAPTFFFNHGDEAGRGGQHDIGMKRVLGQTIVDTYTADGALDGDKVNAILVNHTRGGKNVCAYFMAAKLFSFFAYPVGPNDAVVAPFASLFLSSGLSVRALVEAILKSDQFSSNVAYRANIKSPVEVGVGTLRALGAERVPQAGVLNRLQEQGQRLFFPPNVNGWPSGRAWINASTALSRCNMAASIINSLGRTSDNDAGGRPIATLLSGATTAAEKVERVLRLLVDGDVPPTTREALIAYAGTISGTANQIDEKTRGLFNLVTAQPAYQLN